MSILVVSVSHKSTSVSHLGQLALDSPASAKLADQLVGSEHIDEAVVLSTCNRTELYTVARFHGAWMTRPRFSPMSPAFAAASPVIVRGVLRRGAVAHAFSVAST